MPPLRRERNRPRAYLAGAIEHAPDGGLAWRRRIERELERLGHAYYDATLVESGLLTDEEKRNFGKWKRTDLEKFRRVMRKIIDHDLAELVEHTDYVIAYWDEWTYKGGGTHGELTLAYHSGIPVYLVAAVPIEEISGWILGCCERVFENFVDLTGFLEESYGKSTAANPQPPAQ